MKKILRRVVILFFVFVLGVAGTAFMLNSETTDDRSDMNDPYLPEVMINIGGLLANRMYGYVQPMQTDFTRDSLTPLDTSKKLTFVINPYDTKVKSLSYEIRTSDGSKVMENKKIKNLNTSDSYLTATAEITSDLRMNQEYSMQITLDTGKGEVYYYTRIVSRAQLNTEHYVKFVKSFYEKCMDKNMADDLASYLEPAADVQNTATNFSNISIHSSLSEVSWGNMKPKIYKKGIPTIKEINETTASITMDYQISSVDENSNTEIYDVSEFYRMRYSEARILLLDFQRSANQVFDLKTSTLTDEGLRLGIRDKNVSYMINEDSSVIAFVQQGDLWAYSPENGKIIKIFSFRKDQDGDFRDSRTQHDIKIIRVEEDGDVDFVLYGYMNRGNHEGYSGVCVYHYSNDQNVVEEKVFIPSTESYEFLKVDLGTLSYVSGDNQLYLLFAEKLYRVDIDGGSYEIMEEGISSEEFAVSETNAHAAWRIQEGNEAGQIREIAFDTRETRLIAPPSGEQLRVLGFLNEDLIYGMLLDGDIVVDQNGHTIEGLHTMKIEGFDGTLKKEYQKDKYYITSVIVNSTMMEFELSKKSKSGDAFVVKKKDNIMNNKKAAANKVSVELISEARTGIQIHLALDDITQMDDPLIIQAKMRSVEEKRISLDTQIPQEEIYYVYAYGGLDGTYRDPARAVLRADSLTGVVLNRDQQYVWERGNKKTKIQLNLEDVPEIMRTGTWKKQELEEGLGDTGTVIDLSGCTLDSVLYEISAQRPVVAKIGKDSSVVIVGYDEYNTYLYDPGTKEVKPYGLNDSTALFEKAGNIFLSYVEAMQAAAK